MSQTVIHQNVVIVARDKTDLLLEQTLSVRCPNTVCRVFMCDLLFNVCSV